MSAPAWLARILERPLTDRDRRAAFTAIVFVLIVAALLLAIKTPGSSAAGGKLAPRHRAEARSSPQTDDLRRARSVARHFLHGYLAVVYGHAPARVVAHAAPGILAALSEPRRVPPELARLHPRAEQVNARLTGEAGKVDVTATVSDGEVLTYSIRLLVSRQRDGQLVVAKVGGG